MKKNNLTRKIMSDVAQKEFRHLKKVAWKVVPAIFILLITIVFIFGRSIIRLAERDFFRILFDVRHEEGLFAARAAKCVQIVSEEIEVEAFFIFIIAVFLLVLIILKSNILSFPKRFRHLKKYKAPKS
jgi:hypothetical protein